MMTNKTNLTSCAELCSYIDSGGQPKYVFFWGHQPAADGRTDKSCFSQWFPANFAIDGVNYPTAEHYMMAEKARLFNDAAALSMVLAATTPGAAKAAGRNVRGFDEEKWVAHRWDIVTRANQAKFSQNAALRISLVNTGDRVLVEASPVDSIWGIGLAADDADARHPAAWKGLNLLGFTLMVVRARLQASR